MKDSTSGGIYLCATDITLIASPISYSVVLGDIATLSTSYSVRPAVYLDPFEAHLVVGEFLIKVLHCVFLHCLVNSFLTYIIAQFYMLSRDSYHLIFSISY